MAAISIYRVQRFRGVGVSREWRIKWKIFLEADVQGFVYGYQNGESCGITGLCSDLSTWNCVTLLGEPQ